MTMAYQITVTIIAVPDEDDEGRELPLDTDEFYDEYSFDLEVKPGKTPGKTPGEAINKAAWGAYEALEKDGHTPSCLTH